MMQYMLEKNTATTTMMRTKVAKKIIMIAGDDKNGDGSYGDN